MCTAGPFGTSYPYCNNTLLTASDRASVLLQKAVLDVDSQLRSHEPHLRYRMTQYEETKRAIEDVEGSVADFARVCTFAASRMWPGGKRRSVQRQAAAIHSPHCVSIGAGRKSASALCW